MQLHNIDCMLAIRLFVAITPVEDFVRKLAKRIFVLILTEFKMATSWFVIVQKISMAVTQLARIRIKPGRI